MPIAIRIIGDRQVSVDATGGVDARISAIAGAQRTRCARAQLLAAGVRPSAIDRRVRSGRLIPIHPGVYATAPLADIELADETAALLATGPAGALSHHSAATLWAIRIGLARPVHVTIPDIRQRPIMRSVTVHRSVILEDSDIRVHRGLRVTSPGRTLLDITPRLPDRDIERLLNEAIHANRLVTESELLDLLRRAGGHPGRSRLTRVLAMRSGGTESESAAEEALHLIRAAGLPQPEQQAYVLGYRVDFLWRAQRIAVEVEGFAYHRSRSSFQADRRRDADLLTRAGVVVIRLTVPMILGDQAGTVALLVRAIELGGRERSDLDSRFGSRRSAG